MLAMAGKAAQPDLFSQSVADLESGVSAPLQNVAKQGGQGKNSCRNRGSQHPNGRGTGKPRAGDLSAENAQRRDDPFVMANQGKEVEKSGREALSVQKHYYRLDEVDAYFAISMRTVYRLLDDGEFHVTRIRGCVRVSLEEIRRYEEAQVRLDQER